MVPSGVDNLFIKIGMATRTQVVNALDPSVLKNGTYRWKVPFFSFGRESDTVNKKRENLQFIEVGSTGQPASKNVMYTQDFYLYTKGIGSSPISEHPVATDQTSLVLKKGYQQQFKCKAKGLWGAGGADPYRKISGQCAGSATDYPAGPNIDYEYGSFQLPTVNTPWTAAPSDHCILAGKKHAGCTNASIDLGFYYMAQKIRVPLTKNITLFAEFGTAYRHIKPTNLRYQCKSNVYLKGILPENDCLKKSYLPGSASYPYFAVGYEVYDKAGVRYALQYINIPGQENGNRLTWIDASDTQVYAISSSQPQDPTKTVNVLDQALKTINDESTAYHLLSQHFFRPVLQSAFKK